MKLIEITVFSRMIPAPQENVFDVWMDPESRGVHGSVRYAPY